MAPTSANSQPLRIVFLTTAEAKQRLLPALAPANVDKTMSAPVTAIVAHDLEFYEHLPALMPHVDARAWFVPKPASQRERDAEIGASMQGGYLMLAARALGLDCGPIGGFDRALVDAEFFAGSTWRSSFLLNLGHADHGALHPRQPRLAFDVACRVL